MECVRRMTLEVHNVIEQSVVFSYLCIRRTMRQEYNAAHMHAASIVPH